MSTPTHRRGRIIYVHLHKTGGMSLRGLLVKNYRQGTHFNTNIYQLNNADWKACQERARNLGGEEWQKTQVIKGHMPFGIHRALPEAVPYITFLREPVGRTISHYRMMIRKGEVPPDHQLDPTLPDWNLSRQPHVARLLDNAQTRVLAGLDPELPFGSCTAEHLEMARKNLDEHFTFVGLTERFDLSLMLLERLCGWRWHFYVPDNVKPKESVQISDQVKDAIRQLNRYDVELYRYAEARFDQELKRYGWPLRAEYALFRLGNRIHQRLHVWRQSRKVSREDGSVRGAMRPLKESQRLS